MQLAYKDYGAGHPLIILHGLLGASGNWHTLSSKAFGAHFHVLAVDLRNHGRSPHSDVFDYPSMVTDLLEFMDEHGLSTARLMGHSMGGKAAMHFALAHPDRVDKLIVVDMAPRAYPPHHTTIFEALNSLDLSTFSSRSDIDEALATRITSYPIRQFLLKNLDYDRDAGRYFWKMNLGGIHRNYEHINSPLASDQTFGGPTLFIRGGTSDYIADSDFPAIHALFPLADLVTIDGAGHWVHAEKPEALAQAVLDFLKG
jgi:pimeloyl-ACP methyl ester carboxylesterase